MLTGLGLAVVATSISTAIAFGRQIVEGIKRFIGVIVGQHDIDYETSMAVFCYVTAKMELMPIRSGVFTSRLATVKSTGKQEIVCFDRLRQQSVIYRKGFRFLKIKEGRWFSHGPDDSKQGCTLWLPRIMWNHKQFLINALDYYNKNRDERIHRDDNRFNVRKIYGKNKTGFNVTLDSESGRTKDKIQAGKIGEDYLEAKYGQSLIIKYNFEDILPDKVFLDPFETFPYPTDVMDAVQEVKNWFGKRDWYISKGIAWRRGWCVYGPPGTGKTLLLRSMAQSLNIPVIVIDLASVSNEEFNEAWEEALKETPCMVLFEDIDSVFHGRTNVLGEKGQLTFDCLLNSINGIQSGDGIFLAITTNDIDKIDPAFGLPGENKMSSRPGRIDRCLHLGPMTNSCKAKFASRILEVDENSDIIQRAIVETDGFTAAQFTEYLQRITLAETNRVSV